MRPPPSLIGGLSRLGTSRHSSVASPGTRHVPLRQTVEKARGALETVNREGVGVAAAKVDPERGPLARQAQNDEAVARNLRVGQPLGGGRRRPDADPMALPV